MSLVEVARADSLPEGSMRAFSAGGRRILLANVDNKFYAIDNACTHMGGDLSRGKLEGRVVTCPRHGSRFDVTSGQCLSGPRIWFMTFKVRSTTSYPVTVEGNSVKVDMP